MNEGLVRRLNNDLMGMDKTERASLYLNPNQIQDIYSAFQFLNPFVQANLIQSVVYLSDQKFDLIKNEYSLLVELAIQSSDSWVKNIAYSYQFYPTITDPLDISIPFNIDEKDSFDITSSKVPQPEIHPFFYLNNQNSILPPSQISEMSNTESTNSQNPSTPRNPLIDRNPKMSQTSSHSFYRKNIYNLDSFFKH